jgi:hypothetical protein
MLLELSEIIEIKPKPCLSCLTKALPYLDVQFTQMGKDNGNRGHWKMTGTCTAFDIY